MGCIIVLLLGHLLQWVASQSVKKISSNFDRGLALYLQKEFQPTSVLEYGHNIGPNIDYFHRKCNLSITITNLQDSESSDFSTYDLVYYFGDVTDHDEKTTKKIAEFLATHAIKWLIFRFDTEDIEEHWHACLRERGLIFMPKRTSRLRQVVAVDSIGKNKNSYSVFYNVRSAVGSNSMSKLDDSAYAMRQHLGLKLKVCMNSSSTH